MVATSALATTGALLPFSDLATTFPTECVLPSDIFQMSKIYFLFYYQFSELRMSLFLRGVKFARPICHNHTSNSRSLLVVRLFTQTGFKSNKETAHLEKRMRQTSGIPKKGPTWWESTRKQLGEEWQKAFAGAVFIGSMLFFVQGVSKTFKC